MKTLPTQTAVFAASEDFGAAWQTPSSSERPEAPLSERVARAGRELATLMERFPRQAPVDPLADFARPWGRFSQVAEGAIPRAWRTGADSSEPESITPMGSTWRGTS